MAGCIIKRRIEWTLPEVHRTLYEEVINHFLKVCDNFSSYFAIFGNTVLPKGKTVGTVLFLITSPIEWYKSRSHIALTIRKLQHFVYMQRYIAAKISVYAFSVHFS